MGWSNKSLRSKIFRKFRAVEARRLRASIVLQPLLRFRQLQHRRVNLVSRCWKINRPRPSKLNRFWNGPPVTCRPGRSIRQEVKRELQIRERLEIEDRN